MTRRRWRYWPAAIVVAAVLAYGIVDATDSGRPVPAVAGVDEGGPAPAGVGEGMHIYFGTTHTHTGADNNHGKDDSGPGDVFAAAKKRGFDFLFLTEHSGHTGPAHKAAFYADARHQADLATDDKFVGLAGYEYSDNGGDGDTSNGHITGYGTDDFVDADAPGMDFQRLDDYLVRQSRSHPVIAGFNHPGTAGHGASAERFLTPATRDLFVMTEVHNHDITKNHDLAHAQGMIVELDRGWRVAPTCGIDSHGIYSLVKAEPGPCRTGILAPSLTKQNVLQAFRQRRIYSTRDLDLRVSYQANGLWMGSVIGKPDTVAFDIDVSDPDTDNTADQIKKIDIVSDHGQVVASQTFGSHEVRWNPTLPANGKKFFLVRVYNGERAEPTAYAAPVWRE